jgi:hypothetical protein
MPDKVLVVTVLGIILQYSFVAMIYLFLLKVIRVIYQDLKVSTHCQAIHEATQTTYSQAVLILVDGGQLQFAQHRFILRDMLSLGRDAKNDIAIDDTFVSHEHACIAQEREGYLLTDLNSTNGTFLNGKRVAGDQILTNGDLIKIGPAVFKFER